MAADSGQVPLLFVLGGCLHLKRHNPAELPFILHSEHWHFGVLAVVGGHNIGPSDLVILDLQESHCHGLAPIQPGPVGRRRQRSHHRHRARTHSLLLTCLPLPAPNLPAGQPVPVSVQLLHIPARRVAVVHSVVVHHADAHGPRLQRSGFLREEVRTFEHLLNEPVGKADGEHKYYCAAAQGISLSGCNHRVLHCPPQGND
mmetsp:Transcript_25799/g.56915  ORF Transcript_25799/g.56915 Transcript_25799/m.56915 type:complete len:201 (-) Transcript_25799:538-1140(-)